LQRGLANRRRYAPLHDKLSILPAVIRRVFCPSLRPGSFRLDPAEAHHLRDVLRAGVGEAVELFDAAGRTAQARIEVSDADGVTVRVDAVREPSAATAALIVATAVPKADRADWLVEKLSELGVSRWQPLKTARSVVHPAGAAKFERWRRIAVEAAKQSRRIGVMEIGELVEVDSMSLEGVDPIVLSTREGCRPLATIEATASRRLLLIGPEGGWTEDELSSLVTHGAREVSLTATVLRIETAAVVAAGVALLVPSSP
jgi:16S rRNA (uracil1498-N3)-methyltransferase